MEILAAVLASGAVFSFVQFMITFGFSRHDKNKELEKKIDVLNEKMEEKAAILARGHILRFSDELQNGIRHSNEYFRQTLDDCDTYDRFCETHPNFKNSYTATAGKYIKETYERLLKEGKL